MESSSASGAVTEKLDHDDLAFSVFFAVLFCPFVTAVATLVFVLEIFDVQNDRWSLLDCQVQSCAVAAAC